MKVKLKNAQSWTDGTKLMTSFTKCVCVTVYIIRNILKDMQRGEGGISCVRERLSAYPPLPVNPVIPPGREFFMPSGGSRRPTRQETWGSSWTPRCHPLLPWPILVPVSHNFKHNSDSLFWELLVPHRSPFSQFFWFHLLFQINFEHFLNF